MNGEGCESNDRPSPPAGFDLPAVLAQLDSSDPTAQRAAVETIADVLEERPTACIPAVSKLRGVLERNTDEADVDDEFHETVAYCLAELATESPADVAPSVPELVSFAAENPAQPTTRELLRCLSTIAAERPDALVDHTGTIATVLDRRPEYDRWGLRIFLHLSMHQPAAIHPAIPVLSDALAAAPDQYGVLILSTLSRYARSESSLPTYEFVEHAGALTDHEREVLRTNAIRCLAAVASHSPWLVERVSPDLVTALEFDDPATRATAAVALARSTRGAEANVEPPADPLLALLEDDHERVRANACVALGNGRVRSATDRLAALACEDPSPNVREQAAWAVNRISSVDTVGC